MVLRVVVGWLLSSMALLYAQEPGIMLGRFRLLPSLRFAGGYNSNVLYSNNNATGDTTWRITPEIRLKTNQVHWELDTGYHYSRQQYLETDIQNVDEHAADATFLLKSRRWSLKLEDLFLITKDPADAEILERIDRRQNRASAVYSIFSPGKDLEVMLGTPIKLKCSAACSIRSTLFRTW